MKTLKSITFTPLESPAIYGGDERYKSFIPHRKSGVKAPLFLTGFIFFLLIFAFLYGCASVPTKAPEAEERIVTVNGVRYISLIDLIQNNDLNYDYDTFIRSVTLSNGKNTLSFFIDKNLAVSDGRVIQLSNSSIVYHGELLMPLELKEKIIDSWLIRKEASAAQPGVTHIKKIIIDAGHGGKDPGAISRSGLREKDIVLDIARYLRDELKDCGIGVILTRESDVFIPLPERCNITNHSDANFFISIHINAHRDRSISGIEAFYLSNQIDDYERAYDSKEGLFPKSQKISIVNQASSELKTIIWDIIYTGNRKESTYLARKINKIICPEIGLRNRGLKSARFHVLKNINIPGILLEVGFISNKSDENKLKSKTCRKNIAKAIAKSIAGYDSGILAKK